MHYFPECCPICVAKPCHLLGNITFTPVACQLGLANLLANYNNEKTFVLPGNIYNSSNNSISKGYCLGKMSPILIRTSIFLNILGISL